MCCGHLSHLDLICHFEIQESWKGVKRATWFCLWTVTSFHACNGLCSLKRGTCSASIMHPIPCANCGGAWQQHDWGSPWITAAHGELSHLSSRNSWQMVKILLFQSDCISRWKNVLFEQEGLIRELYNNVSVSFLDLLFLVLRWSILVGTISEDREHQLDTQLPRVS